MFSLHTISLHLKKGLAGRDSEEPACFYCNCNSQCLREHFCLYGHRAQPTAKDYWGTGEGKRIEDKECVKESRACCSDSNPYEAGRQAKVEWGICSGPCLMASNFHVIYI